MKKFVLATIISLAGMTLSAQVNPHAIGLRFGGDGSVNGLEISYQHGFGEMNRLELDLGFGNSNVYHHTYLSGIYHWDWNITEGLNWYVGPGASLGFWGYDDKHGYKDNGFNLGIGGQLGLEYDFNTLDVPLLLSLDARPMWNVVGNHDYGWWGIALGIRYTF